MNASGSRKPLLSFLKDLPATLNTPVPLPAFLTKPLSIQSLIGTPQRKIINRNARGQTVQSEVKKFVLEGRIEAGTNSRFALGDADFEIDGNTWVIGDIEYGAIAKVKGSIQGGKKMATQVIIIKQSVK